ncbi:hypothetical protein [Arthrobacter roseus]|uniref:hypothetical protein n=1 Tax=Arthrobacter roseus TaxID=136274 RepID=UPI001963A891|nr:hypothetical protein [Arthrobacter roseus]MBM7847337.1 hypothetical protein [Arthrobacter roseus]
MRFPKQYLGTARAEVNGRRRNSALNRGAKLARSVLHVLGDAVALVLGFTLSGAVQAFVSKREMQKAMGDHRPCTIVRTGDHSGRSDAELPAAHYRLVMCAADHGQRGARLAR